MTEANGGFDPTAATSTNEEIDVDFSGTSDDFEQLDDGWYLFEIAEATARNDEGGQLLSSGGNPMVKWTFTVTGDHKRAGAKQWMRTVTSGPGAFSLRRFINNAFGQSLGREPMRLNLGPFIGKKFWGLIGVQKNDASFKEIKTFRPENDPPPDLNSTVPAGIGSKI